MNNAKRRVGVFGRLSCTVNELIFFLIFSTAGGSGCQKAASSSPEKTEAAQTAAGKDSMPVNNRTEKGATMSTSHLEIRIQNNSPVVTINAAVENEKQELFLSYSIKNTTGEVIYIFREDPPFIRIGAKNEVSFMTLMPILTPWMKVIQPHIPPVLRLEIDQAFSSEAIYKLPLTDTHPYPGGEMLSEHIQTENDSSQFLEFVVGFFPEKDGNKLFDGDEPGEKIPGYYSLKRQFLASSNRLKLAVPIRRPIWGKETEKK